VRFRDRLLTELAEIYLRRMPMNADIFLSYTLSNDRKTLVEEVGYLYPPNITSYSDFRFEYWTTRPVFAARSSDRYGYPSGSLGMYDPQIRRRRTYTLGESWLKEEICVDVNTWFWITRYVEAGEVPDRFTNKRLIEMLKPPDMEEKERLAEKERLKLAEKKSPYFRVLSQLGDAKMHCQAARNAIKEGKLDELAEMNIPDDLLKALRERVKKSGPGKPQPFKWKPRQIAYVLAMRRTGENYQLSQWKTIERGIRDITRPTIRRRGTK